MTRTCTQGIALLSSMLITTTFAHGQYDTLFVGDAEAISSGPFETPFPTGGAVTARTAYIFYADELSGLLPLVDMSIQGIVLDVLDSDPPGTTADVSINMKNTVTSCMVDLEYTGLQLVADTTLHLDAGTIAFAFDPYFQWNGVMNVVVDFCMGRNGPPGIDPRVTLDTSFVCDPTYYAHDNVAGPCEALTTATASTHGPFDSRPVMGFLVDGATPVGSNDGRSTRVALYPNPATDRVRLRLLDAPSSVNVQIFNATGALEHEVASLIPDAAGFVDLQLPTMPAGCHLLKLNDDAGRPILEQRFVVE